MLTALILAAGESRRFHGIKQLAELNGSSLLNHVIEKYKNAGIDKIFVALGANYARVLSSLNDEVSVIRVKDWHHGMGHSLAVSVSYLRQKGHIADNAHVMIGLGDQVAITSSEIRSLIRQSAHHPDKIVAACYNQMQGVPAIFCWRDVSALSALSHDIGAKKIIQNNANRLISIDIPSAAIDIDTREDLRKWQHALVVR